MAEPFQVIGNNYTNVHTSGSGRSHLGNIYNYGPSSDEKALQAILESLSYPGMKDRRDTLTGPSYQTFQWALKDGPTSFINSRWFDFRDEAQSQSTTVDMTFRTWLEGDDRLPFCFMGKPGSGKSTLMKYIATDPDTAEVLVTWSTGFELLRAEHFVWLLGTDMQKRLEGIFRSLLHSALYAVSQMPREVGLSLLPSVCGSRWTSHDRDRPWSIDELKQMLSRLSEVPQMKMFFLVDALDECEPQDDLGHIVDAVLWISRLPRVKLCISCRPWNLFTRKLEQAPKLHLDQLSYSDMEAYISMRLQESEAELGVSFDFREGKVEARRLIYDIANKAEGVFLWTVLVVKALGSEPRKGGAVERLSCIASEVPIDLDTYFEKLIFERIPKTRSNQSDTAAALKLAMEIERSERDPSRLHLPDSRSFVNFWLLINGSLVKGFSWKDVCDSKPYSKDDARNMVLRTRGFLEETCKDLLVMVDRRPSFIWPEGISAKPFSEAEDPVMDWDVRLLHRAVFDFLCDNKVNCLIEQYAPAHFSEGSFLGDLAELRNVHILQDQSASCAVLENRFEAILYNVPLFDRSHVFACESIMVIHLRVACNCFGLAHQTWTHDKLRLYTDLGLSRYLLLVLTRSPHIAFCTIDNDTTLTCLLLPSTEVSIEGPDLALLRCLMSLGCDPERPILCREPADIANDENFTDWCEGTPWEKWLTRIMWQSERSNDLNQQFWTRKEIKKQRKKNFRIACLLLEHGANPGCTPCITRHGENDEVDPCQTITLRKLLASVVLAGDLGDLRTILATCSGKAYRYDVRKRQRMKAVKLLLEFDKQLEVQMSDAQVSAAERSNVGDVWRGYQYEFVNLMVRECHDEYAPREKDTCKSCLSSEYDHGGSFSVWCLDCEESLTLCGKCAARHDLESFDCCPREGLVDDGGTATSEHIVLPLFLDYYNIHIVNKAPYGVENAMSRLWDWYARNLGGQGALAKAMFTLRDWYVKNTAGQEDTIEEID